MPSRFFSLVIVAFWLATSSWLVQKDVWPTVETGAPPFGYDLIDEAPGGNVPPIRWGIYRTQGTGAQKRIGRASTWVVYRQHDDTFELHNQVSQLQLADTFFLKL